MKILAVSEENRCIINVIRFFANIKGKKNAAYCKSKKSNKKNRREEAVFKMEMKPMIGLVNPDDFS